MILVLSNVTLWHWNNQMWVKSMGTIEFDNSTIISDVGTA